MKHVYTWIGVLLIALASTAGDVLLSHAMKRVGDLGELRRRHGIPSVVKAVFNTPSFFLGVLAMAFAFYCLLFALSWGDVSLVGPASASLTFIFNAAAAKVFLRERVDRRRWLAALLVAGGVVLLAA